MWFRDLGLGLDFGLGLVNTLTCQKSSNFELDIDKRSEYYDRIKHQQSSAAVTGLTMPRGRRGRGP